MTKEKSEDSIVFRYSIWSGEEERKQPITKEKSKEQPQRR